MGLTVEEEGKTVKISQSYVVFQREELFAFASLLEHEKNILKLGVLL